MSSGAGPSSRRLFRRAERVLAGGVNSPVRAFAAVGGTPFFTRRGRGVEIEDEDGNRYLDFVSSWGPLILGHAHGEVVEAIARVASDGTSFGTPCRAEVELAEAVAAAYPGLETVRFVSSGTEATMSAIRLARGATGRDAIVKFSGCYHGHADHLLVSAGSGMATFGQPSSAGVPRRIADLTHVLPLDDEEALADLFESAGGDIAAVIIEPVPANNGLLLQRPAFLETLRRLTRDHGTLLIFDEVISGFRIARGGAAEHYGITPDLVTFGKIIGGGLPVGAFGGSRELMRHLAPAGDVYQAGTLSGNPLAMAAGLASLRILERERTWDRLEDLGGILEQRIGAVLAAASLDARLVRLGSIFWLSLQTGPPPRAAESVDSGAADCYRPIFHGLLERGVYLAPSAYEVGFLGLAHRVRDVDRLAAALSEILLTGADENRPEIEVTL